MKRSQFFRNSGPRYLRAKDIPAHGITWRIRDCREVTMGKPPVPKAVVYFHGESRGLVLNITNWITLETAFGEESDNWVGKYVHVFTERGQYKGEPYVGTRLRGVDKATDAPF